MAQSQEAKQKAYRIPHDYHRRPDPTQRAKQIATALALLATLAVVLWLAVVPGEAQQWHSPGPVAQPHAMFESDCEACHIDFTPVRSDATPLLPVASGGDGIWDSAVDRKCRHCHDVPRHNSAELAAGVVECAGCHRDHEGVDFDMSRVTDDACTTCHRAMKKYSHVSLAKVGAANVTAFPHDHPDFRSLKSDPGLIRFPHDVHLKPGQPKYDSALGSYTKPLQTLSALSPGEQARYRKQGQTNDLVQLVCADCHVPDHSHDPSLTSLLSTDGRRMQPIRFESHCQACHPLKLSSSSEVPHGRMLYELEEWLEKELTAQQFAAEPPPWLADSPALDPVPGEPSSESKQALQEKRNAELARSIALIRQKCAQCHFMEAEDIKVAQPMIPVAWLKHARFNHETHRSMDCQGCHSGAAINESIASGSPQASNTHTDVLIPNRDLCAQCHAPATTTAGGARADCAECHRYHGGSHELRGGKRTETGLSIEEFLRGGK